MVLALYRTDDLHEHREALCEWLKANNAAPHTVALRWISVEDDGSQRSIRFHTFRTTATGSRLIDPDDPSQAWTEERTAPLRTDLPKVGHGL
ncbi:hypothetical protein ADK47_24400 [Streptomyces rimosus subsp. rimosus]|uniref:Uncharacterized protein n=1 Tax=Streptomyces rimosus subsp. rimosus TaxID=132474 RepID=A0ABY3Z7C5_STRRM|nr:hypothetical protein ADK78_00725 [Kitasatospora aureofaciens]KOT27958.1 hypothetical protein ADK84_37370 [Streptomyces sp. NRRL WC-3701]KOT42256.1 hypothetical protein ADK42_10135 [Streptomyces rimosus subsp. rimosus]QDA07200.1 hypothetical protein CTZ40_29070 [Streptomyces rimosus]KOT68554.1 hypothetical protein ADK44_00800 [Streptomyces rimosus subsp. rimosus]